MKKNFKKIAIILIGLLLVGYAAFKMGLFPSGPINDAKKNLPESISGVIKEVAEGTEEKSLQEQIAGNLDSGLTSNKSREEEKAASASDFEKSLECFYVTKVVDGDTIWVSNDDHPNGIKVRYIGIDTPESVVDENSTNKKNTEEGKIASNRNKELIEDAGYDVYLEYDMEKEDQYGRTLAYVYTFDFETGEYTMLEDVLLSEGLCKTVVYEPNVKYKDHFKKLEDTARKSKAGFFGTGFYK